MICECHTYIGMSGVGGMPMNGAFGQNASDIAAATAEVNALNNEYAALME